MQRERKSRETNTFNLPAALSLETHLYANGDGAAFDQSGTSRTTSASWFSRAWMMMVATASPQSSLLSSSWAVVAALIGESHPCCAHSHDSAMHRGRRQDALVQIQRLYHNESQRLCSGTLSGLDSSS